jgi:hypothetical protein
VGFLEDMHGDINFQFMRKLTEELVNFFKISVSPDAQRFLKAYIEVDWDFVGF